MNFGYKSKELELDILRGKWDIEYQSVLDKLVHNFGYNSLKELKEKGTQKEIKEYFILERELLEKFAKEESDLIKKANEYDA